MHVINRLSIVAVKIISGLTKSFARNYEKLLTLFLNYSTKYSRYVLNLQRNFNSKQVNVPYISLRQIICKRKINKKEIFKQLKY